MTAVDEPTSASPELQAAVRSGSTQELLSALAADASTAVHAARIRSVTATLDELGVGQDLLEATALFVCLDGGVLEADDLGEHFDADAARLAHELNRLGDVAFQVDWAPEEGLLPNQAEALRRMLLALVADVRLVLVKLADHLYHLTQAREADAPTARRLAMAAREVYAPLANRLGVWQIKWQLEDLALRYLDPDAYHDIAHKLHEKRSDRERYIESMMTEVRAALEQAGLRAEVTGRPKHIYSIWRKMKRKGLSFDQLLDLRALRILVDSVADCYAALGVVHSRWPHVPGEFDDYIATPKDNAYQSLHTAVFGEGRVPVEVQIRTHEMHEHAELGVAAHWRYKEDSRAGTAWDDKVAWLRRLLEPEDADEGSADFIDRFKAELFADRIYVFSPKGEVVELPAGATPLDYAYTVHTEIGHRCKGARVNGRMVPLTRALNSGDRVEILTARNSQPSRNWLRPQAGYLVSGRNRAKVRAWFRRQDQEQNRRDGRVAIERELARLDQRDFPMQRLADLLDYEDVDALALAVGSGEVTSASVASALLREIGREKAPGQRRRRDDAPGGGSPITIEGIDDVMSHLAQCCRPLPPEPLCGYITVGRGMTIHRADCTNLARLLEQHPERIVEVQWASEPEQKPTYTANIVVYAEDRQGLLRDITSTLADQNVSIHGANTRSDTSRNRATLELSITVGSMEQLTRILTSLERVPSILSVQRR